MGKCKDCKSWESIFTDGEFLGNCNFRTIFTSEFICGLGEELLLTEDIGKKTLIVGANFGCIHWERREDDHKGD